MLSKGQLTAKVNAICTSYKAREQAVSRSVTSAAALPPAIQQLRSIAADELKRIGALTPQSSLQHDYAAYIAAVHHQIGVLDQVSADIKSGNRAALNSALAQGQSYDRTVELPLSTKLGFTACNQTGV
jgi:hypothetical protein